MGKIHGLSPAIPLMIAVLYTLLYLGDMIAVFLVCYYLVNIIIVLKMLSRGHQNFERLLPQLSDHSCISDVKFKVE